MRNDNRWLIGRAVLENILQDRTLSYMKDNSEFHYKSGMSPKVVRTSSGRCCKWCDEVAGTYDYPNVPKEVWRRHKNCDCTVEYYPGDGKKQNAYTKAWSDDERQRRINSINSLNMGKQKLDKRVSAVTEEYIRNSVPGTGKLEIDKKIDRIKNIEEIKMAKWLKEFFGGNIRVKAPEDGYKKGTPDYIWNEKKWELKSPTSKNAIDKRLQKAGHQLGDESGGIVLNISKSKLENDEAINYISAKIPKRVKGDVDVIVIKNNTLLKVLKYKK